jgi:hypothetical protein
MALLDVEHNANYATFSAGDLGSPVVRTDTIDPSVTPPVDVRLIEVQDGVRG